MKIYQFIVYCVFVSIIFSGCNSDSNQKEFSGLFVVNVSNAKETDQTVVRLSQFAESISYIRLSEEPLIGAIRYSPVRLYNDTFYLAHENIYKYDSTGKFIKKIFKEGRGAGEALKYKFSFAAFCDKERYITFHSYSNHSYMTYSFDGEFLGSLDADINKTQKKQIKTYFNNYLLYDVDNYVGVGNSKNKNRVGPNLFYAQDIYSDTIYYYYPNPAADENPPYSGGAESIVGDIQFINNDSLLWFKYSVIDTLYSTSDFQTITPRYIFKTNNSFININQHMHIRSGDFGEEVLQLKEITGVLPFPNGSLLYTVNNKLGFFDGKGNTSDYSEKRVENDLDDYLKTIDLQTPLDLRAFSLSKNHLYLLIEAFEFFEEGCSSPFSDLNEESNPVILKIKLKK
ncbi:MAG: 6-bladed beta-propeller [Dysgonamonadaceae bacterium]|jgi:hypothetical protein|nr:6-bladed beta-propeller [Dysgonamonadaceae bacterium]